MNMRVKDVELLLEHGFKTKDFVEWTGLSTKVIQSRLRKAGFTFNRSGGWVFATDEKNDELVFEVLNEEGSRILAGLLEQKGEKVSDVMTNSSKESNSEYLRIDSFTEEEIISLKEMAEAFAKGKAVASTRGGVVDALNSMAINVLAHRKRQSYNINETVQKDLDKFAKEMRLSQSDLVELAIVELLEKYNK